MFTIFEKAFVAVAWLGLPSADRAILFQFISDNSRNGAPKVNSQNNERSSEATDEDVDVQLKDDDFLRRAQQAAVWCITDSPYFKRCWVRSHTETELSYQSCLTFEKVMKPTWRVEIGYGSLDPTLLHEPVFSTLSLQHPPRTMAEIIAFSKYSA